MRIFNEKKGIRGIGVLSDRLLRFQYMITEQAQKRTKILTFWKEYGTMATEEAFGTKERTLFNWQAKLRAGNGKIESLNSGSHTPKTTRKRLWDYRILEEIRQLRDVHPNLGEKKLYPLLKKFCDAKSLPCPKPITIGRLMNDMGGLRKFPEKVSHFGRIKKTNRQKVLRKPKHFKTTHPGHLVALDSIEKFIHGCRRYLITFEDVHTRFSFAWCTTSHASQAAAEFFALCQQAFPFPMDFVLTDNGSEFKKNFAEELKKLHLTHYHTYPRTPKMNAHMERFNRTIQEEFVDFHTGLLMDPVKFNHALMDWLIFYNTERVHWAFGNKLSPMQFLVQSPYYQLKNAEDCKRGWGYTPI
jgi:transposase InsO family protein